MGLSPSHPFEVIDGDQHFLEPPDMWDRYLPQRFRDRAPRLIEDGDGGQGWLHSTASKPHAIALISTPGFRFEDMGMTGVRYDQIRPGCYDGAARAADMCVDGIDRGFVSGPQTTLQHFLASPDDDFLLAGFQACNDFLIDEFCAAAPGRLLPMPQIPSLSIESSLRFLSDAVDRGARAVLMSGWPSGQDAISDDDELFWAAAGEARIPLCIHVQMISARTRRSQRELSYTGPNAVRANAANARAMQLANLAIVFGNALGHMNQLILTGVFERHPGLRVVMLEVGVGWIPHYLEQLDDRYWRLGTWASAPINERPSFYWRRNMAANVIWDPSGIEVRHRLGVENIIWSSDYPHHVCDWPRSQRTIDVMLGNIPIAERAAIVGGNARRIYRLDPPDNAASSSRQQTPAVSA
jgi:predicted TIM-barrel fold metal-dependent hydrolase